VTTLASPNDTMTLKDIPHMVNIISLLTRCLKPGLDHVSDKITYSQLNILNCCNIRTNRRSLDSCNMQFSF
jgi:hypothetical protein